MNLIKKIILCILLVTMTACFCTSYKGYGFFNNSQLYDYLDSVQNEQFVDLGVVEDSYSIFLITRTENNIFKIQFYYLIVEKNETIYYCVIPEEEYFYYNIGDTFDMATIENKLTTFEAFEQYQEELRERIINQWNTESV